MQHPDVAVRSRPVWLAVLWLAACELEPTRPVGVDEPRAAFSVTGATGAVVHEETRTGSSHGSQTISTGQPLTAAPHDIYLAAISTRNHIGVTRVSGLGLSWQLLRDQCGGRDRTGVEVWQGAGAATHSGRVTATLASAADNAVIAVSRYAGPAEVGAVTAANANGVAARCEHGKESRAYAVPVGQVNGIVYAAAAIRGRRHTAGAGFTERAEVARGEGGNAAGLGIVDGSTSSSQNVTVRGTLNGKADWAVVAVELRPAGSADLDVAYIERTPRYYRYAVEYEVRPGDPWRLPRLCPGTEQQRRWPNPGELVTYTAHVVNRGRSASAGFGYEWVINGSTIASGELGSLGPGERVTVQHQRAWPAAPEAVALRVDPALLVDEDVEANNVLAIGSHDLTLSIWVEQGLYDIFNRTTNLAGSRSFEDWIQAQFAMMNQRFAQAIYPVSPAGIRDRVRIDKIVVAPQLDGEFSGITTCDEPEPIDPDKYLIDGRWQFTDGDVSNGRGAAGNWQEYVDLFANNIDWGLIHELAHQLGVIDLYVLNLANQPAENNRFFVRDLNGNVIPASAVPNFGFDQLLFQFPGIMVGGSTDPYRDQTYFESHTAGGMNSHYNHRRGYFGEYLFDTPATTRLRLLDAQGNPLAGVAVQLYQANAFGQDVDDTAEIAGTTDVTGRLLLPNRAVVAVHTATGHTLRPNPFGQIFHEGTNGKFFVRAVQNGQELYGWLFLLDLNVAYWSGQTEAAEITVVVVPPSL